MYNRYRISLKVDDGSGSITMTLFDYEAAKMFGKTAKDFVDEEEEVNLRLHICF